MKHLDRKEFVQALGVGAAAPITLFPGVLWAKIQEADVQEITPVMVLDAARVAGLQVTPEQAEGMVGEVEEALERYREIHLETLGNHVPLSTGKASF